MEKHIDKDCIFCKLANGEIPTTSIYEDEEYVEYSDYSSDYICPRTLIYLIPNTSLGAELTGVKISRM